MNEVNAIVAGAGIWGCTLARRLAEAGRKVLVLEKRPVVGGNVRCEIDPETGIEVHTYGSHIFHTHIPEVWNFVNRFVTFNGYQHKVLACTKARPSCEVEGREVEKIGGGGERYYHLPLGLTLINKFFGVELKPGEVDAFLDEPHQEGDAHHCPPPPSTSGTSGLAPRRQAIFDAFFRGYTSKQWGKAPEEIDPSIIQRVPVRRNYDTNYFNDYNQGIPTTGYNSLFERLLDHPNIIVQCNCSLVMEGDEVKVKGEGVQWINSILSNQTIKQSSNLKIFYSGPIDALFNYKFGHLPWRTLRFERETLNMPDFQGTSVVNYPDIDVPYTRIHEFKHYHPEREVEKVGGGVGREVEVKGGGVGREVEKVGGGGERKFISRWGWDSTKTVIMREYSATWQPGDEPYYPINNAESAALLARYQAEVEKLNHHYATSNYHLTIGGRLGGYKYFDIDQSIAAALALPL